MPKILINKAPFPRQSMTYRSKSSLSLAFAMATALAAVLPGLTQEDQAKVLDARHLPKTSARVSSYVPKGWQIGQSLSGDLNNDGVPDTVLCLLQNKSTTDIDAPRGRALLVLLKKGSQYNLVGTGERVLICTTCGGMLSNPGEDSVDVTIKSGVIVIKQLWGSREACDCLLRFRWDVASGRMMLIGADIDHYDRGSGASEIKSTNYLTQERIITNKQLNQSGQTVSSKKRSVKVKAAKYYLESLDPQEFAELP